MKTQSTTRRKNRLAYALSASMVPLLGGSPIVMGADQIVIDLFTARQVAADVVDGGAGDSQSSDTGLASILGGQRDINTNALTGADDSGNDDNCDVGDKCSVISISDDPTIPMPGGTLRFNNDTGVIGEGIVQWDGPDQDIALVEDGLGGIDLTAGGTAVGFGFTIYESDQTFIFAIEAYTDATHFTKFKIQSTAVAPGFPITRFIPFAAFEDPDFCDNPGGTGDPQILAVECGNENGNHDDVVDFTNLGAMQVLLNLPDADGNRTTAIDLKIGEIVGPREEDGNGRIAPTGTTCEDFVNERETTSDGLPVNLASFTMTVNKGKIFNVSNPGAAFYFTRFTTSGDVAVNIVQDSTGGPDYEMNLSTWQLFEVVPAGEELECVLLEQDKFAKPLQTDESITFFDLLDAEYAMRIRMEPKSIQGEDDPVMDLTNDFRTEIDGTVVDRDPDGVLLKRIEK